MRPLLHVSAAIASILAWLYVADTSGLGLFTIVVVSAIASLGCLLLIVVLPRWERARSEREYRELLRHDAGHIVGKARYRNRRVLHYADGSVAGQAWGRMKSFGSFDEYRSYVDRR
jgi:hypothetical protein